MYKMVSLQMNASKVALAGLLAASLCGGSMMVGASTAYAGEVTISNTADANALSYNAFKLFNATKNDDGSVSSITWVNDDIKNAVLGVITANDPAYAGGTNAQACLLYTSSSCMASAPMSGQAARASILKSRLLTASMLS